MPEVWHNNSEKPTPNLTSSTTPDVSSYSAEFDCVILPKADIPATKIGLYHTTSNFDLVALHFNASKKKKKIANRLPESLVRCLRNSSCWHAGRRGFVSLASVDRKIPVGQCAVVQSELLPDSSVVPSKCY